MAENAEQKRLFTEALHKQCGDEDKERTQFLTERKYEQVCAGLEEFYEAGDASAKKAVQKVHSQVYAWAKKYELVSFKDSKVLIFKNGADGDDDTLALDQAQVVSRTTVGSSRTCSRYTSMAATARPRPSCNASSSLTARASLAG